MRSAISQFLTILVLSGNPISTEEAPKAKRSPLEIGFVTFTERPHERLIKNGTFAIKAEKDVLDIPSVVMGESKPSHTHKWVPGHVRHHAYIPPHLDHLYLPTHALLLARAVETVLVQPEIYQPYRSHYGGFGIGVDVGGQGAGHGFHVVFDL